MNVSFVAKTVPSEELQAQGIKTAEDLLVYCARVSSPQNQGNVETGEKLLRYCIRKKHWSVFEQADLTIEVETSRAISAQILRHKSLSAQEFSQRYSDASTLGFEPVESRLQDLANRQNSFDHTKTPEGVKEWFTEAVRLTEQQARLRYSVALEKGIAKETARFLLPMSTTTRLYLKASVRGWIHYLQVRCGPETQLEHRQVAEAIREIFNREFPTVAKALAEVSEQ